VDSSKQCYAFALASLEFRFLVNEISQITSRNNRSLRCVIIPRATELQGGRVVKAVLEWGFRLRDEGGTVNAGLLMDTEHIGC
jgi:hypothetical protein